MTRRVAAPVALVLCAAIGCLGCGGGQPQPEAPSDAESAPSPATEPPATATGDARPELTAQACEAGGGAVVGDIGDGAIHRPDYRCPSGSAPRASIRAPEGGPVAVEGAVCCPK
jgi:hypothetical protein